MKTSSLVAILLSAACGAGPASDISATPGDEQDVVTAKAIVGKWTLDGKANTDRIVTWWDELELKADGTFAGSEGGNVCDDDGNCEAGTSGALDGTYTLGSAGSQRTIIFRFSGKKPSADRFTFTVSGGTMKMQLASDGQKGGEFSMVKE